MDKQAIHIWGKALTHEEVEHAFNRIGRGLLCDCDICKHMYNEIAKRIINEYLGEEHKYLSLGLQAPIGELWNWLGSREE